MHLEVPSNAFQSHTTNLISLIDAVCANPNEISERELRSQKNDLILLLCLLLRISLARSGYYSNIPCTKFNIAFSKNVTQLERLISSLLDEEYCYWDQVR